MAYRGTVASRAKLFYQHRNRFAPSFLQTHRDDSDSRESLIPRSPESSNYFQHRLRSSFTTLPGPKISFGDRRFAIPAGCGVGLGRNFSSGANKNVGDNKIEVPNDTAEIPIDLLDALREVGFNFDKEPLLQPFFMAIDSFFPVAALQNLICYLHFYTGLNWWASIVSTNFFICSLGLPHLIKLSRACAKLTLVRQKMDAIREEMGNQDMNPTAVADAEAKLLEEYGVTPLTRYRLLLVPLISFFIYVCFDIAVSILKMKYPSFKEGGIFWFTDLTTRDSTYLFPVFMALITCPILLKWDVIFPSPTMKNVARVYAALAIPLSVIAPKTGFLSTFTTELFVLGYIIAMMNPAVKKKLGIPIIPLMPPPTNQGIAPSNKRFRSLDKGRRK